jgi:hypothetical protein
VLSTEKLNKIEQHDTPKNAQFLTGALRRASRFSRGRETNKTEASRGGVVSNWLYGMPRMPTPASSIVRVFIA